MLGRRDQINAGGFGMPDETRFCVDCHYCVLYPDSKKDGADSYWCTAETKRNLVTGGSWALRCFEARDKLYLCGPEAKWFKPKEKDD